MTTTTRRFACTLALALGATAIAPMAFAQSYPSRPVTLVVPFPPGGGTDTGGRVIAEQLSRRWGQTVIVENKGGAAGQIGADLVAKAKPDGYTLLLGNIGTQAINPSLYAKLPYDPDKAFAPVSLVAELPLVMMVNPAVAAQTPAEFIALAKAQAGKMSYSSSGAGGAPHLVAEMFKDQTRSFIVHVPYRGGGPAIADLLAGHVDLSFMTALEASGHIKAGKLRALAVTSDKRLPALPDVPTLAEGALPGFNAISWIGMVAPAGTPQDIVDKIAADVRAVLADEAVKARFAALGGVPRATSPQDFGKLIAADRTRYAEIIRSRKITTQ
ncbi:tripartite tricarboxylate transporter substrate binding protein [Acidovorax sp. CCYZU-2555]|uniref:Bug family tripartite tricarboxylate transporter substrate binding protein n=1 Tax=Acidovorax sp. CCYZU-2555 TaxID=2835042 RepID=UPI001BCB15C9|nr:tripartite tricarboxylate transporter substrate binding protein [Acidovorax sp. CCYZU-2555]MBS7778029.1 tripartite tricarboxylate transporter substrate binding protein [Acidovorax sp. CCYZU-2555]